jgi:hypothetical protein
MWKRLGNCRGMKKYGEIVIRWMILSEHKKNEMDA